MQIHPHCFIGDNVKIGDNSILFSGIKIYNDCVIGKDNLIHAGVKIGADGFVFAPNKTGSYKKIQQIGNVVTHDFVTQLGDNTLPRSTFDIYFDQDYLFIRDWLILLSTAAAKSPDFESARQIVAFLHLGLGGEEELLGGIQGKRYFSGTS